MYSLRLGYTTSLEVDGIAANTQFYWGLSKFQKFIQHPACMYHTPYYVRGGVWISKNQTAPSLAERHRLGHMRRNLFRFFSLGYTTLKRHQSNASYFLSKICFDKYLPTLNPWSHSYYHRAILWKNTKLCAMICITFLYLNESKIMNKKRNLKYRW